MRRIMRASVAALVIVISLLALAVLVGTLITAITAL
jgi:hypothetical protein